MAPRFSRRKGRPADPPDEADEGSADLGATEHAWWAQRELEDFSTTAARIEPPVAERDVLAEHLGESWRSDFELDPILDAPLTDEATEAEPTDPMHDPNRTDAGGGSTGPTPEPAPAWERWDPFEPWTPSDPDAAPPTEEPATQAPEPPFSAPGAGADPYEVLEVSPSATWEEIVAAHRRLARVHHPDRFHGQAEAEIARAEDRIRAINIAYQELRVRRGR